MSEYKSDNYENDFEKTTDVVNELQGGAMGAAHHRLANAANAANKLYKNRAGIESPTNTYVQGGTTNDFSQYYSKILDEGDLSKIDIYTNCTKLDGSYKQYIRYNVLNILYFYFILYHENEIASEPMPKVLKEYKKILAAMEPLDHKGFDLKGTLTLGKTRGSLIQQIKFYLGVNTIYPLISPFIPVLLSQHPLIKGGEEGGEDGGEEGGKEGGNEGGKKGGKKGDKGLHIITTSIDATNIFKIIGYFSSTPLVGLLFYFLQGNKDAGGGNVTKQSIEQGTMFSWIKSFLINTNLIDNEAKNVTNDFKSMFGLNKESVVDNTRGTLFKNKILQQLPESTIMILGICFVAIIIAPYIFLYSKKKCSYWGNNSNDLIDTMYIIIMFIIICISLGSYIGFSILFCKLYIFFVNIVQSIFKSSDFIKNILCYIGSFVLLYIVILSILFLGPYCTNFLMEKIYVFGTKKLKLISNKKTTLIDEKTTNLLYKLNYSSIVEYLFTIYKIQFFNIILLLFAVIVTTFSNTIFDFFGLDFVANLINDFIFYIITFIITIGLYIWYYLNISNDKKKTYTIITLIVGLAAVYAAIYSIQSYLFVHRILDGHCDPDRHDDDHKPSGSDKKSVEQILYEKFIVPILPVLIIILVCVLYAKNKWSFLFQIMFVLVIALYITTSVYYPGTYGFICSVFIIFLIFGKWSNIIEVLFGLVKHSSKNKSCK